MLIEFTPDFFIHVAEIDAQHRELINRLNDVGALMGRSPAASKEETEKTLEFLSSYVIKHFSDEEALQRKIGYPLYKEHLQDHQYYLREVDKLKEEYKKNGYSTQFEFQLNKSIILWILEHIMTADRNIGTYIREKTLR